MAGNVMEYFKPTSDTETEIVNLPNDKLKELVIDRILGNKEAASKMDFSKKSHLDTLTLTIQTLNRFELLQALADLNDEEGIGDTLSNSLLAANLMVTDSFDRPISASIGFTKKDFDIREAGVIVTMGSAEPRLKVFISTDLIIALHIMIVTTTAE